MDAPPRYPVLVGPTAGGKSALAVALCHAIGRAWGARAEIVTADAFQIYRGMDIGTATPTTDERGGIPHHLIDLVDPRERFTVKDWLARADPLVEDLRSRGVVPVVVGGTNLYIQTFLDGMFEAPEPGADTLREIRVMPQRDRRAELARVDPDAHARIDPGDERRTIRALGVHRAAGVPISALQRQWDAEDTARRGAALVGLGWAPETINPRINARVRAMIDRGLVEEARALWASDAFGPQSSRALGYRQLIAHFEGRCTLGDAIERIKIETRRFAKNQRTWLKRFRAREGSVWIEPEGREAPELADEIADALARDGRHDDDTG